MAFGSQEDNDRRQGRQGGAAPAPPRDWRPLPGNGNRHDSSEDVLVDVAILKAVGFTALGALVLGWLGVSCLPAGRAQRLTARIAAAAMYLALACLFTQLTQDNWEKGRAILYVPFGFLLGVFVAGFFVTLVKWTQELTSAGSSSASATH